MSHSLYYMSELGFDPAVPAFPLSFCSWQKGGWRQEEGQCGASRAPQGPPKVCELLSWLAPGVRKFGISIRLGAAGSSQSNYCPICLSAHSGRGQAWLHSSGG